MPRVLFIAFLSLCCAPLLYAQQTAANATLHGRVTDARSGEPIAKVKINVAGSPQSATTDEHGTFAYQNLPPGELTFSVTTVGYGLVKKTITVKAGENTEIVIALNQEAATLGCCWTTSCISPRATEPNA